MSTDIVAVDNDLAAAVQDKAEITVGELERFLLTCFPLEDACDWDRTGMFVGDPQELVRGVAVALDPTVSALKAAVEAGANVLISHHPVFLSAPESFLPYANQGQTPGAVIHYALTHGLSILSFHTACDASIEGLAALPSLLGLDMVAPADPLPHNSLKGFGMICSSEEGLNLEYLAARCVSVFGSFPRVWGNASAVMRSVVTCGGSAGDLIPLCLERGVDCLVCGEVKYHDALDAAESGLSIIELGHDVSEFPLCALLASKTLQAGIPESCITVVSQSNWFTPESIRQ